LDNDIKRHEAAIYDSRRDFNLASPKQLGDVLFDKLKIGGAKQKKTKNRPICNREKS
jgi:DNA polymerase-1